MPHFIDLTGYPPFGRLTVQALAPKGKNGRIRWWCLCTCGQRCIVPGNYLTSGDTRSCGCLRQETTIQRNTTHNLRHTAEYRIFNNIKNRCRNPNVPGYKDYGGRGIRCLWETFEAFYHDMGPRPDPTYTIERKENNGHYCRANCIWLPRSEQAHNKRNNIHLTFHGKRLTLAEWERELGICTGLLSWRLKNGWTPERALTTLPPHLST
jgi:hypothetical protein